MCVCTFHVQLSAENRKRDVLDPLGMEFRVIVNGPIWVMRSELGCSRKAASTFNF